MTKHPNSIKDVVEHGLCIGCGLCQSMAPDRWKMTFTTEGRLRPMQLRDPIDDTGILAVCPGAIAQAENSSAPEHDEVWGGYTSMSRAWAGADRTRFQGATGGVLTALGMWLLKTKRADFILHCAADTNAPMRSKWQLSRTPQDVLDAAGSRYGPTDTLAGLETALATNERFAIIAKPCDAGAVRALAKTDPRIDAQVVTILVLVCGGASDLSKSKMVLDDLNISEDDLTLFRYRGYGNPGPTRIEMKDGKPHEKTYLDMWADEAGWRIQTRCKICPDAIGEAADLAASDIWLGGAPTGEDAGFNGVICRTDTGQALFEAALKEGAVMSDHALSPRKFDDYQPHQVSKKRAAAARLRGLTAAGFPIYQHYGLRIDALDAKNRSEEQGTKSRAQSGRFSETLPTPETQNG